MTGQQSDPAPAAFEFDSYRLDLGDERLFGPDGPIKIGRKAYGVLKQLLLADGRLVTKDELFETVWRDVIVSDAALTSVVKELRRALGDTAGPDAIIETVYGRGYRFDRSARVLDAVQPAPRKIAQKQAPPAGMPAKTADYTGTGKAPLIAVARFDDRAIKAEQPYFASVLREEVLFALSRFSGLRLVAEEERQTLVDSALLFGPRDYRLDVTLSGTSGRTRIVPRVSALQDGRVIWAERFMATGQDTASMIERLAAQVVGAVMPRVEGDLVRNLPDRPADLYDRYFVLARRHSRPADYAAAQRAAADWTAMIDEYPDFTLPYPKLIKLLNSDHGYTGLGSSGPAERDRARRLAARALALDETNAHLHVLCGWCALWSGNAALAHRHLAEAVALNPFNADRLLESITGRLFLGDLNGSEKLFADLEQMAPFTDGGASEERGLHALLRGDYEAAAAIFQGEDSPSVSAQLYRLIAAEARGDPATADLAAQWRGRVGAAWHTGTAPERKQLIAWIERHHPFQQPDIRARMMDLAVAALGRH